MPWALVRILFALVSSATPYGSGYLTHYAPGVAESVVELRQNHFEQLHGPEPNCLIALNEDHVGKYAILVYEGGSELCRVIDAAQAKHVDARISRRYIAEVDYNTYWRLAHRVFPDHVGEPWLPRPLEAEILLGGMN